ncbi:MAG: four helix bundle protein [Luteolibacter sp.]
MADEANTYDLEERTFQFALAIRNCASGQTWKPVQWADINQLLRSSGSVAANYVEANNAVSKPDFLHRISISKQEAMESKLWLRLLGATSTDPALVDQLRTLHTECDELVRILATIHRNSSI